MKKVEDFKYFRPTVQSNRECGKEAKKRVGNGWRKVSRVMRGKSSSNNERKVYKTVVRPAMLCGLKTVALRKRQEAELEVAKTKMLRLCFRVTWMDRIRNECHRDSTREMFWRERPH